MEKQMRRFKQQLDKEQTYWVIDEGSNGTLALVLPDGKPYALPISYVRVDDSLYFHCAKAGLKLQAIQANPYASFVVVIKDQIIPEKFTTVFVSAIADGPIGKVEDHDEIVMALQTLAAKYSPELPFEAVQEEIAGAIDRVTVLRMEMEEMTGKQGIELLNRLPQQE